MDSPMTTPTSPNTKIAELERKQEAFELKQEALQSTVDLLSKQLNAMNIETRKDDEPVAVPQPAKKPKKESSNPAFALPWTGTPISGCCQGIRSNYDTYTQCHQACSKGSIYCKTCAKNCGDNGIPKDGNVETRSNITKKIKPYIHFMNAKQLSKQDVINEAKKFGITLSDEIFEKPPTATKGRPKKTVAVANDSDDDAPQEGNDEAPAVQILGLLENETAAPNSP
jgi:hypothetical protein